MVVVGRLEGSPNSNFPRLGQGLCAVCVSTTSSSSYGLFTAESLTF